MTTIDVWKISADNLNTRKSREIIENLSLSLKKIYFEI